MFGAFQTAKAQQKPNWLNDYPSNPLYYIGIAGIQKQKDETDYKAKARDFALSELISQIEVNVSSITETFEEEINGEYENSFTSLVQLQAQKTIEDYEIVDAWENEDEYWVYVRLSRQEYEIRIQQKIELAQAQAYTALIDGRQEFESKNYAAALALFVNGMGDVSPYLDRISPMAHNGEQINLFAELRSDIRAVLGHLKITEVKGPEEARIGKPGEIPFSLKIVSNEEGKPATGIPVHFWFTRGDGELENIAITDDNGTVKAQLSKLTGQDKMQIVSAEIALDEFLAEQVSNDFLKSLLDSFNPPSTRYILKVSGVPVYLDYSEMFLGEEKNTNYIQPVLKEYFTAEGYTFIDDMNGAELYITLTSNARTGSETYGLYSAFLDYNITITSLITGEEIAAYSTSDIKGMSDSYEKAAAAAYKAGIDSLQVNLIPRLISQIQK